MSDTVDKKYKILFHTITFNIIVFNEQKQKKAGAALVAPAGFLAPEGQKPEEAP